MPSWSANADNVCVKCGVCDYYMDFIYGSTDTVDGKWTCDFCGASVTEKRVYNKIEKENEAFRAKYLDEDDD